MTYDYRTSSDANQEYFTFPLAASIYVKGRKNKDAFLTHVCRELSPGHFSPLCGKVKGDHVLSDAEWDGEGSTERKATCPKCARLDPRPH